MSGRKNFKTLAPKDIAAVLTKIGVHPAVTPETMDMPDGGHSLAEGDQLKLGRFKFRVRQLAGPDAGSHPEVRLDSSSVARSEDPHESASKVCRICLMEGGTD